MTKCVNPRGFDTTDPRKWYHARPFWYHSVGGLIPDTPAIDTKSTKSKSKFSRAMLALRNYRCVINERNQPPMSDEMEKDVARFSVQMDGKDRRTLEQLAKERDMTAGAIVRQALKREFREDKRRKAEERD